MDRDQWSAKERSHFFRLDTVVRWAISWELSSDYYHYY